MPKSTVFFAVLSLLLTGVLGFTIWHLLPNKETQPPQVRGVADLGLPGLAGNKDNELNAVSAVLYDAQDQKIIFEHNSFERRSIASLTKLMAAMVALDYGLDWDQQMEIQLNEYTVGGNLLLHPGETATVKDLFTASLLSSANNATLAYVRSLNIPEKEFIRQMNRKAVELELEQTRFTEVTGLDKDNVSTAYEIAQLAAAAFTYPEIRQATSLHQYTFQVGGSEREHTMRNSNKLFNEDSPKKFAASKTGYIYEAGYCLVVAKPNGQDKEQIAVLLGSPNEAAQYVEIEQLLARGNS